MRLVITFLVFFTVLPGLTLAEANIAFDRESFDFGKIPHTSTVVEHFWVKSTGTDTLVINEIKTGCDCATMPLERNWIAPGDSMRVGFYWETEHRLGNISRKPTFYTNAPGNPVQIRFEGTVMPHPENSLPLTIKPFKVSLSKVSEKIAVDSLAVEFINHSSDELTISVISSQAEEIEYAIPEILAPGESKFGFVRVKPGFWDVEFIESITIEIEGYAKFSKKIKMSLPVQRKVFNKS